MTGQRFITASLRDRARLSRAPCRHWVRWQALAQALPALLPVWAAPAVAGTAVISFRSEHGWALTLPMMCQLVGRYAPCDASADACVPGSMDWHLHGQQGFGRPPCDGAYVFANRSRTRLKLVCWDDTGVWTCLHRLHCSRVVRPQADEGRKPRGGPRITAGNEKTRRMNCPRKVGRFRGQTVG